jgi:hypothetical protein
MNQQIKIRLSQMNQRMLVLIHSNTGTRCLDIAFLTTKHEYLPLWAKFHSVLYFYAACALPDLDAHFGRLGVWDTGSHATSKRKGSPMAPLNTISAITAPLGCSGLKTG